MSIYDFGFKSLFSNINKAKGVTTDQAEGLVQSFDELDLTLDDEELIALKKEYENTWKKSDAFNRVKSLGDKNERYWLGKQGEDNELVVEKKPYVENIIFEGLETFLPIATKKNPDALVTTDNTPEMSELGSKVTSMLSYIADKNNLKLLNQRAVRNWLIRYAGVIKIGWDAEEDEIMYKVIRTETLILDPNATITNGEYKGAYLGELKEDTARNLTLRFPKKKEYIKLLVNEKMGSTVSYTEWWTKEYLFCTLGDEVLSKHRNPHWNYGTEDKTVDEYGKEIISATPGKNHFKTPKIPYAFLSVFSTGDSPVDKTSLIQQGINFQDLINERGKQLVKNIRGMNGGTIVSGLVFNKEQAAQVGEASREGRTIRVPTGDINTAFKRDQIASLPPEVYQSMQDYRMRFLSIFGIAGSIPSSTEKEDTVRGKIIMGDQDDSRIGGGVTNHIESMDSYIYNYTVQMMYVYYDEPHIASIIGPNASGEYITLQNSEFPLDRKLFVRVQEGSLIPKNELTSRNEAMDLWAQKAIDPITLNERLHDATPEETAFKLFQWMTNPQALFANMQQPTLPANTNQPISGADQPDLNAPPTSEPPVNVQSQQVLKQVPMNVPMGT